MYVAWQVLAEKVRVRGTATCLNIFHGNSSRVVRGLKHSVYGKGIVRWKRIHHPQDYIDAFGLYQNCKVKTEQHQARYGSSIPFLAWSGSCKGRVWQEESNNFWSSRMNRSLLNIIHFWKKIRQRIFWHSFVLFTVRWFSSFLLLFSRFSHWKLGINLTPSIALWRFSPLDNSWTILLRLEIT